jgi:uncharacterized protein YifN (PemK superfamily)
MKDGALRLALEVLKAAYVPVDLDKQREKAITAIKAALEAKDEPVAWRAKNFYQNQEGWFYVDHLTDLIQPKFEPLYTTPPQRTWVELTDEEMQSIAFESADALSAVFVAEAKLKEKNT